MHQAPADGNDRRDTPFYDGMEAAQTNTRMISARDAREGGHCRI